ncbi:MAG: hypothetical protein IPM53_23960 [Anaerolineaceae bacterium]|nr:hypothetical protein [Anaerolineaceae bacterium]
MRNSGLLEIVAEDLRYLQEEWGQTISNHALRRGSTVLRSLLVQKQLHQAWNLAGFDGRLQITTSSLKETLSIIPKEKIIFAASGGALYKDVAVRGALVIDKSNLSEAELNAINLAGFPEEILSLHEFVEATCVVAEGQPISRRTLINYVANALGGAHYDTKRDRKKTGKDFSVLDRAAQNFEFEDKNLVYFELLAIGQAIANSRDVEMLRQKVGK